MTRDGKVHLLALSRVGEARRVAAQLRGEEAYVLAGSMAAAEELERRGLGFLDEWSYLSADDVNSNWHLAHDLSQQITAVANDHMSGGAAALVRAAEQEWVYPLEACLNASLIYRRVLESMTLDAVHAYVEPHAPLLRTGPMPVAYPARRLAMAVLHETCARRGIPFMPLNVGQAPWLADEDRMERRLRRLGTSMAVTAQQATDDRPIVLFFDRGMDPREAGRLESALDADGRVTVLRGGEPTWDEAPLPLSQVTELHAAEALLARWRDSYTGPGSEVIRNRYLDYQFSAIWQEIRRSAGMAAFAGAVFDAVEPRVLVLGHDAFTRERVMVGAARSRGIRVVSLVHCGIGPAIGYRGLVGDADELLVWGERDRHELVTAGVDSERVKVVGSWRFEAPRYDRATRHSRGRMVLLTTAAVHSGHAAPVADPTVHRQTWRDLFSLMAVRTDVTFVLKPHPSNDHVDLYRLLMKGAAPNIILDEFSGLGELLREASVVLMVNYVTTAGLEALLADVPVVILKTADLLREGSSDALAPLFPCSRSVAELSEAIDDALASHVHNADRFDKTIARLLLMSGQNALQVVADNIVTAAVESGPRSLERSSSSQAADLHEAALAWRIGAETTGARELHRTVGLFVVGRDRVQQRDLATIAYGAGLLRLRGALGPLQCGTFVLEACVRTRARALRSASFRKAAYLGVASSSGASASVVARLVRFVRMRREALGRYITA